MPVTVSKPKPSNFILGKFLLPTRKNLKRFLKILWNLFWLEKIHGKFFSKLVTNTSWVFPKVLKQINIISISFFFQNLWFVAECFSDNFYAPVLRTKRFYFLFRVCCTCSLLGRKIPSIIIYAKYIFRSIYYTRYLYTPWRVWIVCKLCNIISV